MKLFEEKYEIKNGIIKSSTYGKKKHLTKMSSSFGEFHMVYYTSILKKYTHHSMLRCLIGEKVQGVKKTILFSDINYVMTERDYNKGLKE